MRIAPIDIAHKTFSRKVMGLDAEEVSEFLRDVADQMEEIIRERNSLKEVLRQKEIQIMEYKERDETLKATIATATKMSDQIRADAEREGKLIVSDAQQKAEIILKDSRDSLKRIYQEIADLKRTRMQFEVNLRSVCQAHLAMLDQSHMTIPDPQINLAAAAASVGHHGTSAHATAYNSNESTTTSQSPTAGYSAPTHNANGVGGNSGYGRTHSNANGTAIGSNGGGIGSMRMGNNPSASSKPSGGASI